jgi:TolB-like protein
MRGFITELRRRRVFRTAAVYIVSAWLILQVADVLFPGWGLSDAAVNVLFVAAVIGFPLALVFGWFFDVTMHGIVRTPSAEEEGGDVRLSLRRSDYIVLIALTVVAGAILYSATTDIVETPRIAETGQPAVDDTAASEKLSNSIAVLPFSNISDDPGNEAFCVGISEEILHKLSEFAELNVIGRTSSFAFQGSDYGIPRISALLGVQYLLQGSVRKHGDRLRISAQLVDETGVQRWSEAFDRTLADIFAIQTEIADVVATMVVPQISPSHATRREPDLAAYQHFLTGRELFRRREVREARDEIARAMELDPEFAEAHAEYAIVRAWGTPDSADIEAVRQAIDTALSLRPGLPRALAAKGLLFNQQPDPDYAAAESVLREALEKEPNMVDAMNWMSMALNGQDRPDEALAYLERALRIDPVHGVIGGNVAWNFQRRGDVERAEAILLRIIDLPNPTWSSIWRLAELYLETGRLVDENATYKRLALTGLVPDTGLATNYALLDLPDKARYWAERVEREFPNEGYAIVTRPLVLSMAGRYAEAVGAVVTLAPLLANSELDKVPDPDEVEARRALAWAYAQLGARDEAEQLLRPLEEAVQQLREQGLAHSSGDLFNAAQTALQLGERDLALDRFEAAVRAGWRQYYRYYRHPIWAALADNPRYQALMAEVKADVDRQRAEVMRIDAEEDFPALLDKVRASRP